jgi:hypothetical protein
MATNTIIKTVGEAPKDGSPYSRQDGTWVSASAAGVPEAPTTLSYVRTNTGWIIPELSLGAISGTTFNLGVANTNEVLSLPMATQAEAGLLSADDKVKVDNIVTLSNTDSLTEGSINLYNKLPAGGSTGEVLAKVSATDYDLEWSAAGSGIPEPSSDSFFYVRTVGEWIVSSRNFGDSLSADTLSTGNIDQVTSHINGTSIPINLTGGSINFLPVSGITTLTVDSTTNISEGDSKYVSNGLIRFGDIPNYPAYVGNRFKFSFTGSSTLTMGNHNDFQFYNCDFVIEPSFTNSYMFLSLEGINSLKFYNCSFDLTNVSGNGTSIIQGNHHNVTFDRCNFIGSAFEDSVFTGSSAQDVTFSKSIFTDCTFTGSNMSYLYDTEAANCVAEVYGDDSFYAAERSTGSTSVVTVDSIRPVWMAEVSGTGAVLFEKGLKGITVIEDTGTYGTGYYLITHNFGDGDYVASVTPTQYGTADAKNITIVSTGTNELLIRSRDLDKVDVQSGFNILIYR